MTPAPMAAAFAGLLDDAAVFPPGNAPLPAALAAHQAHHAAWYAGLAGPFVFPAARLGELGSPVELPRGLSVTGPASVDTIKSAPAGPGLVAVELAPSETPVPDVVAMLDAELPAEVIAYLEIPRGPRLEQALDAIAGTRYLAKFRTGGTVPQAHPGERELAEAILAAVSRGVSFKCTAGLHHALRHTDGDLEQHGFLNVLLATDAALDGAAPADLAALLSLRSLPPGRTEERVAHARTRFLSFGTCSIDDPVTDLQALGLLTANLGTVSLPAGEGFGLANLPYCVFSPADEGPRCGVRFGDQVLDLAAALDDPVFAEPALNAFMAQGRARWAQARQAITDLLSRGSTDLIPLDGVSLHLPFEVGDYVDFYASEQHATNVGQIFRPGSDPLTPNWKHLPIGYHGRSGTVVPSGTGIIRPHGQRKAPADPAPTFGPSRRMDFEAEVGFVIGAGSELGTPIPAGEFADHVFGVFLVNDWSSRDLQAWEYVPLGPFLGKSFATSISPWVVPLDALSKAWVSPPPQDPEPLPYLSQPQTHGLDLQLEVRLNGELLSSPPFATMYWTPAQMLAHLTVNGASTRTGDFYASGTVSGPTRDQFGSMLELNWGEGFLADGDEITITATAPAADGSRLDFGEVTGTINGNLFRTGSGSPLRDRVCHPFPEFLAI
jgi:fumarylacetoacetase